MLQDTINKKYTTIQIEFWIIGENLDFSDITDILNLHPSNVKRKKDYLLQEYSKDSWGYQTNMKETQVVSDVFEIIYNLLYNKIKEINYILQKYSAECGFNIICRIENNEFPDLSLERKYIYFSSEINAEVNFSVYYYKWC